MKLVQILAALTLTAVLCFGSLMCCSLLFGTICGHSLWTSEGNWAMKAMLLAGTILPPGGGLYLTVLAAKQ